LSWDDFYELIKETQWLEDTKKELTLSTGFIYGLLELADMADPKHKSKPEKAMWRSQLSYRIARMIQDTRKRGDNEKPEEYQERTKKESTELICKLADKFKTYGTEYHIPLYTHLYTYRD
jgi:hypothetical protein